MFRKIKKNLQTIVNKLHELGICVIIQTIPPFNYSEEQRGKWQEINNFIKCLKISGGYFKIKLKPHPKRVRFYNYTIL